MHARRERPSLPILALACSLLLAGCQVRGASASAPPPGPSDFEFADSDITALQARMSAGTLDSLTLTRAYLRRISALDDDDAGPRLNAVIELNPAAVDEARARDAERRAGTLRGALHGIPVLLKDNIDATPMATSAGALALAGHHPAADAFLVERLRQAGAVILGKANLSEWANFRSTRSSSGWSSRGGQTRNPHVLDRNPCGSSSGSAVAVAAELSTVAVGTETDGSVICPASVNGIVGVKPTVGLVSRRGIIPISHTQDTAGPMARSVADAAALLTAMAGADKADAATIQVQRPPPIDYVAALDANALRGARIGVLRKHGVQAQPEVDAAYLRALASMRDAGAILVDVTIANDGGWDEAEFQVLLHEFKDGVERYLAGGRAPLATLDAVIAFNQAHAAATMPWFGQELLLQARDTDGLAAPSYAAARDKARRLARLEGIEATLRGDSLDAVVAPATGPAWLTDPVNGDHFTGANYGVAAVAGTPSVTVPMGDSHGLPFGLVFMGAAWSEPRLLSLAHAFELRLPARKRPQFLSSLHTEIPIPVRQAPTTSGN